MHPKRPLKILLTGKNGQVGWELNRTLAPMGKLVALGREELDLEKPEQISKMVRRIRPDVIVNAAAYTAVDKAEEDSELAMAVNAVAPGILAEEAKRLNALLVHYSTDYIFDGTKTTPYVEDDAPNPINVYGRTKLAGEQAIRAVGAPYMILRTSWVYGTNGRNFLLTILRLAEEKEELKIVDDQVGTPTWSRFLAGTTAQMLQKVYNTALLTECRDIYNVTPSGQTSWYGFAKAIIENYKIFNGDKSGLLLKRLIPVATSEYPTPACRPAYSVLSNKKLKRKVGKELPKWGLFLEQFLKGI
ncbi:dTDP-4-dehydrorhamnose reductase [Pelotomaculum propionicicum]|uniref:dTDP-4-dehydrorhamnose reductase n=1 Tax=Pelotomaculum propionicicum TaxID=258475 RepID=UPI003B7F569D